MTSIIFAGTSVRFREKQTTERKIACGTVRKTTTFLKDVKTSIRIIRTTTTTTNTVFGISIETITILNDADRTITIIIVTTKRKKNPNG